MMEDKIETGEYIRVNNDNRNCIGIGKATRIVNESVYVNMNNKYNLPVCFQINNIAKHSKQLIDLIEAGDLIIYRLRGLKHQGKGFIRIYRDARSGKENLGIDSYSLEPIEIIKILTHEQIEQNCYKVGGENE